MNFIKSFILAFIVLSASTNSMFAQNANQSTSNNTKTITLKVKGITCSSDLKTIALNVEKLKGVSTCKAGKQGTTSSFEIIFDPKLVSEKEIHRAIEDTGGCKNPDERPYKIKQ